jgi:hypothetical protein
MTDVFPTGAFRHAPGSLSTYRHPPHVMLLLVIPVYIKVGVVLRAIPSLCPSHGRIQQSISAKPHNVIREQIIYVP